MMIWSSSSIPMIFPASLIGVVVGAEFFQRRFRICRGAMKKDVPAVLDRIADLKVPLGWIRELFRQPMLT